MHYLTDLDAPHHAANITAIDPGSTHVSWEAYADQNRTRYTISHGTLYTGWSYNGYAGLANGCGWENRNLAQSKSSDKTDWDTAARNTVTKAQNVMSGVLNKFFVTEGISN